MEMDASNRNGSRTPELRTIHIEHTVPVRVLGNLLKFEWAKEQLDENHLLHLLMSNSICVAMDHKQEESFMKKAGVPVDSNVAYQLDGSRNLKNPYPFLRYKALKDKDQNFRVFNVVSGQEIDIQKFTFRDHEETLKEASKAAFRTG
jgi:hypothetical protein